jgi:hypothetical protein
MRIHAMAVELHARYAPLATAVQKMSKAADHKTATP